MFMIKRSLGLIRRHFSKVAQDARLSDSYQLTETEIAAILGKPMLVKQETLMQEDPAIRKDLVFGLPKRNEPFPLTVDPDQIINIEETSTQNLYQVLQLNGDSSIADYLSSVRTNFHNEMDLYGSESPLAELDLNQLEFTEVIKTNSEYLLFLRTKFLVNTNIPGTIELQDPNNFLDLRPIEDFRHTPLIPISETAMKKFKEEMQERHNKAFYLAVKTETLLNVGLFVVSVVVILTLFGQVRKGSDKKALEVMRLKHRRMMGDS